MGVVYTGIEVTLLSSRLTGGENLDVSTSTSLAHNLEALIFKFIAVIM